MSQPLAERIAQYAHALSYDMLPPEVVHEVKRRVIDSVATAVGAMDAEAYHIARRCAERVASKTPATMLGGGQTSPEWAAFVNGLLIRYLDYNDTYLSLEPAHPSDNFAAVWAAAEAGGADGKQVIAAAALAYEIQCRLCDEASLRKHGVDHVTYGAISTAAAAGKLLGLDAGRIAHAVNIAGVANIAIRQTRSGELSMWKGCAFANAARAGVFAALLAGEGMTGPAPLFEGDLGFVKLVSRQALTLPVLGGTEAADGSVADFMITRTYIKFWPAEYHSQSAIDAALQLREEIGGDWKSVKSIDIQSFDAAVDIIAHDPEKWRPQTRETADHSLPYCAAVALADGEVTLKQFDPARFADPELLALVAKVKVDRDVRMTARYPRGIPNEITLMMDDGTQHVREVEFPRGHAENPMTDAEVEQKFRAMVEPRYGKAKADAILAKCRKLEQLGGVGELLAEVA